MAEYHLHAQVMSRGTGRTSVAAAAYRARCSIEDERTGMTHDYSRHQSKCVFEGIYAPKDAPDWTRDRAQLWNHVEAFEKHKKAELAREIEISLPHELTLEQQRYALQDWVRENITRKGLIADVTIHAPHPDSDQRNTHAHVMVVMRKLDGTEFERTKPRFEKFSEKQAAKVADLKAMRESWARIANRHLERHGHDARIDHRSLEEQGIDRTPGIHLGKTADEMEQRGVRTDRGDRAREAANQNQRPRHNPHISGTHREALDAYEALRRTDPVTAARIFGEPQHRPDRADDREAIRMKLAELAQLEAEAMNAAARKREQVGGLNTEQNPESIERKGPWTAQTQGWDELNPAQQDSACRSYEAWLAKRDPADRRPAFTVPEYVEYVQAREAERRTQNLGQDSRAEKGRVHQVEADLVDRLAQDAAQQGYSAAKGERMQMPPSQPEAIRIPEHAPRDPVADRLAWATMLRGLDSADRVREATQQGYRAARGERVDIRPPKEPEATHTPETPRHDPAADRAAIEADRSRVRGFADRLDAAFDRYRHRIEQDERVQNATQRAYGKAKGQREDYRGAGLAGSSREAAPRPSYEAGSPGRQTEPAQKSQNRTQAGPSVSNQPNPSAKADDLGMILQNMNAAERRVWATIQAERAAGASAERLAELERQAAGIDSGIGGIKRRQYEGDGIPESRSRKGREQGYER